jgi:hypothetical protein
MDPDMGRLLAGRAALEAMPAGDRERHEPKAARSRMPIRSWLSAIRDSLQMRPGATGAKEPATRLAHRQLNDGSTREMS